MAEPRLPETVKLDAVVAAIRREHDTKQKQALAQIAVELQTKESEAIRRKIAEEKTGKPS